MAKEPLTPEVVISEFTSVKNQLGALNGAIDQLAKAIAEVSKRVVTIEKSYDGHLKGLHVPQPNQDN